MKNNLNKLLLTIVLFAGMVLTTLGQVTSSGMNGKITGNKESLPGAAIVAIHVPSGSQYGTVTNSDGRFTIQGMRPGGPYTIEISFIGYSKATYTDVSLYLGEPFVLNADLKESTTEVDEIVVVGAKPSAFSTEKTGAATNVTSRELASLPTISRSLNDFTRLSPLSGGSNSFAGRDGRLNNINIDGANFNNNFGLSSKNMPGGDAEPISLDAIEEVQVNVAPFDVRQANFTGAGINAITKSGTNKFKGSAYTFYRDQSFNGMRVDGVELPAASTTSTKIYGASVGGPIIKDKLFFFVNGEYENSTFPGMDWLATDAGRTGTNVSRTTAADLSSFSSLLKSKYGYETGAYENYGSFATKNHKILARIDWNINRDNKFSLRYNTVKNTNDQLINASSAPSPRSSYSRVGKDAMSFQNSNYGFENTVNSIAAELRTNFGEGQYSNQILGTFTHIQDKRTSNSDIFPFIDIYDGTYTATNPGNNYMSAGYELFSFNNNVLNDTYTLTDNFTSNLGNHIITAGLSYEYLTFGNSFMRYGTSYYRYKSLQSFVNDEAPIAFGTTYSLVPGVSDPVAALDFAQFSGYIQDEYNAFDNLKITYGIRMDLPQYLNMLTNNPAVSNLTFYKGEKINLGQWPSQQILWSPRIGFNWDVFNDKSLRVRGGTGIFTGRLPFVFFTNMPTNSGMLQNTVEITKASDLANLKFNADPAHHLSNTTLFPTTAGTKAPGSIAGINPNFKMPQVWRNNLAADIKLPHNMMLTLEGLYTRDINAIIQRNANLAASDPSKTYAGPDSRPIWGSTTKINSSMSEAMVLDNTDRGYSYSLTSQLTFPLIKGFNGMIAYTHSMAKDISGNPGSQAASAWSNNLSVRGQNDLDLSYSQYMTPDRVVGSLSYRIEYVKHMASTISLFYSGYNDGNFSYRYGSDFNKDGINSDLMYIPASPGEINFEDITTKVGTVTTVKHSAQKQSDAFFAYIEQDAYLSAHKGQYAERNGAKYPWYNRFDLKFLQDFYLQGAGKKHTLQLSCDILNLGNLLNSAWGVRQRQVVSSGSLLSLSKLDANNRPLFKMVEVSNELPVTTFENSLSTSSTWGIQLGLRYIFD